MTNQGDEPLAAEPDTSPTATRRILGFPVTTLAWALVGAIAVAIIGVTLLGGRIGDDGRLGGDFPAFYAAGSIVLSGDLDELYDPERQALEQEDLLGGIDGYLAFAYPPPVAAFYALFALFPYPVAYLLHTVVMAAAIYAAFRLVRPLLPTRRPPDIVLAAVAVTFVPLLGVAAGQNTGFVVLFVAAVWRLLADGRIAWTGVPLGLLLFKPQYAVPLAGLLLVGGYLRTLPTFAGMAAGWWAAGAAMLGTDWVTEWVSVAGEFDADVNATNAISWLGLAENAFGVGSAPALVLGGLGIAVTAGILIVIWWRGVTPGLALPMAAASVGILLTSPHSMHYDAGLLTLTAAGLAIVGYPRLRRLAWIVWGLGLLHPLLAGRIGFTPVAVAVIGTFVVVVAFWWREGRGPAVIEVDAIGEALDREPDLSIIIPAYDEAGRIEPTLRDLAAWVRDTGADAEVIVVDDGSTDDTAERVLAVPGLPHLRVLRLAENRGKGYAVRTGMLAATGRWRVFLDADGSTAPAEIPKLLAPGAPVVIGSVAVADADLARPQSGLRSSAGRFGNRLIQRLVLPGIEDSQRGCKAFRGDVAEAIFSACEIDRWGFDVEVLARARALGHEPVEVGVVWEDRPVGHVRPWHYATTLAEVLRIRRLVGFQPPVAAVARAVEQAG